jgi:hypothetical protein
METLARVGRPSRRHVPPRVPPGGTLQPPSQRRCTDAGKVYYLIKDSCAYRWRFTDSPHKVATLEKGKRLKFFVPGAVARSMPRSNSVRVPRPDHDEETQDALNHAHRLVAKGELAAALQLLKRGADAALARGDDRRALTLAGAAAELRATRELELKPSDPASAVVPVATLANSFAPAAPAGPKGPPPLRRAAAKPRRESETIDVDAGWLECAEADAGAGRNSTSRVTAEDASLGEAVRVWVGLDGGVSRVTAGSRRPRDSVEALLVTHAGSAGLAQRLRRA